MDIEVFINEKLLQLGRVKQQLERGHPSPIVTDIGLFVKFNAVG